MRIFFGACYIFSGGLVNNWFNLIFKNLLSKLLIASAFSRLIIKQLGSNEDFASLPCLPEQFQHPSIDMKRVETSFFFFFFLILILRVLLE